MFRRRSGKSLVTCRRILRRKDENEEKSWVDVTSLEAHPLVLSLHMSYAHVLLHFLRGYPGRLISLASVFCLCVCFGLTSPKSPSQHFIERTPHDFVLILHSFSTRFFFSSQCFPKDQKKNILFYARDSGEETTREN